MGPINTRVTSLKNGRKKMDFTGVENAHWYRIFGAIFVPLVFMRWKRWWTRTPYFPVLLCGIKHQEKTQHGSEQHGGSGVWTITLKEVSKIMIGSTCFWVMFWKWTYRKPSHGDMVSTICLRLGCASLGILAHLVRGWLRSTITSSVRYLGSITILRRWTRSPNS